MPPSDAGCVCNCTPNRAITVDGAYKPMKYRPESSRGFDRFEIEKPLEMELGKNQ